MREMLFFVAPFKAPGVPCFISGETRPKKEFFKKKRKDPFFEVKEFQAFHHFLRYGPNQLHV